MMKLFRIPDILLLLFLTMKLDPEGGIRWHLLKNQYSDTKKYRKSIIVIEVCASIKEAKVEKVCGNLQ